MKKNISAILFILVAALVTAQNNFEYERAWGTYYGPAHSGSGWRFSDGGVFTHPLNPDQVFILSGVHRNTSLPLSYYNQYITAGGQSVNADYNSDILQGSFDETGNILTSTYITDSNGNHPITEHLIAFDHLGQGIYLKKSYGLLAEAGTAGAWYPADPNSGASSLHSLIYKKDQSGNVIWKTFLPVSQDSYTSIVQDENSNIYILGKTEVQQGLATAGSFYTNYELYYTPNSTTPEHNGFVAKLNPQGALQWATYLPVQGVRDLVYFANDLYVLSQNDVNPAHNQMATAGTWQTAKGGEAITRLDAATGNRVWGTYFGNPATLTPFATTGIQVNATGIYLAGIQFNFGNNDSYFATSGAHKTQVTGSSDLYLTRFTLNGSRIWGTYMGSDGVEMPTYNNPIALNSTGIFITGGASGDGNNIATSGAFIDTKPNHTANSTNLFFSRFDLNGNQEWCSYYGGPGNNPSIDQQNIGILTQGENTFYLYGSTTAATGIATESAYQTQISPNISTFTSGFLARFDLINPLGTTEADPAKDLVLYNNPNSGNFSLSGSILAKEKCGIMIYDMSGRVIYQQALSNNKTQQFNLEGKLSKGNYLIEVTGGADQKLKVFKMTVR